MVLPSPSNTWIKKTNQKIIKFIFQRPTPPVELAQLRLPMSKGGLGLPCIETFWNLLKIKLLLKTDTSRDPYATLFNTSLNNFGYKNFPTLAKEPPSTMQKIAKKMNHPFWSGALSAYAAANIGFPLCSKSNLLKSPIIGNPIFGKPFDKKFAEFDTLVYGKKMYPWTQSDFMIDLSDLRFEHVITESGYVTREELSAILATEINEIEYHKFKKCVEPAVTILNRLPQAEFEGLLYQKYKEVKGCSVFNRLILSYKAIPMEDFTSSKYWMKKIDSPKLTTGHFKKHFNFLSKAPFSISDKVRLLKMAWNITGTNKSRAHYEKEVLNTCNFCTLANQPPNKSCQSGSLYETLYDCECVKSFINSLKPLEAVAYFEIDFTKESRFIFQIHREYSKIATFLHKCINLYLTHSCRIKKVPQLKSGLFFINKLIRSSICMSNEYIETDRLLILLDHFERTLESLEN